MVITKSTIDYEQYKKELLEEFSKKYDSRYAEKFLEFIEDRYKDIGRVFLDKNLMWILRDDYARVMNGNIQIYLVVGLGNSGKTTLAKNMAYFMDKEFRNNFLAWGFKDFVKQLDDSTDLRKRSYLIDEPNDVPNSMSKEGIALKRIFGQLRQQQMMLFLCSTDFKDIPPTVVRKVTTLIYLNAQGHGYLIRDRPELNEYPLFEFKKHYEKEGYASINRILKKFKNIEFNTHAANVLSVLDEEGEKNYGKDKVAELKRSLREYHHVQVKSYGKKTMVNEEERKLRNERVTMLKKEGYLNTQIANMMGLNKNTITSILKETKEVDS